MLRLTLVRHAKSSWDYPELSDFERPLNARGKRDAPAMAQRLAAAAKGPLHLLSSPALRAVTTARAFAETLGMPASDVQIEPRIYEASAPQLLEVIRQLDDAATHVVLFGHNPGLSDLARDLAQGYSKRSLAELPTCAVLTLRLDARHWREVKPGAEIERYDFPRKNGA